MSAPAVARLPHGHVLNLRPGGWPTPCSRRMKHTRQVRPKVADQHDLGVSSPHRPEVEPSAGTARQLGVKAPALGPEPCRRWKVANWPEPSVRQRLVRLLAVGDPLRFVRSSGRPCLCGRVQSPQVPDELTKHRLRTGQRGKRLGCSRAHSKVREGVGESIEQGLAAQNRRIHKSLNVQRISRNLVATGVCEHRYVCDSYWVDARIQDLDLNMSTSRQSRPWEHCYRSTLKRSKSKAKNQAAVRPRLQDSMSFGSHHEAFSPVDKGLPRKARRNEAPRIKIERSVEAPTPQSSALADVAVGGIGYRTKHAWQAKAVELLERGRQCRNSDGWHPVWAGHQASFIECWLHDASRYSSAASAWSN